jgi:hypothetical protein
VGSNARAHVTASENWRECEVTVESAISSAMPAASRWTAQLAFVAVLFAPVCVSAQTDRLRLPTIVASTAAAGDWISTYHALRNFPVREANPLLAPWRDSPGKLVSVGALMDGAGITAWNLTIAPNHPRVAAAGLWAMAAFRAYLVIHNVRTTQRAERQRRLGVVDASSPSTDQKN